MNEQIILEMAQPYVKDGSITYDEFENIYSMLSLREQYGVTDILYKNGINLVDAHVEEEALVLDVEDPNEDDEDLDDEFEVLYDESIFKDSGTSDSGFDFLITPKVVKQSNEILCSMIQQGNRQAAQDLCIKNRKLVGKYAVAYDKRYGNQLDFEDLEQAGFVGLLKAAVKFDIQSGNAFSTYAVYWIKQSIAREIMDNGYVIRIPVHMMERINKVNAADNRLANLNIPLKERIALIADELGYSDDEIRECMILKKNYLSYTSLDIPIGEDEDSELGEFIADTESPTIEEEIIRDNFRQELELALSTLTMREQKVLKLRFGLEDGRPRTLEEVGEEFHVTRERIRQIQEKAFRKLRHPSRSKRIRWFLEE